jgi:hypothetical protein
LNYECLLDIVNLDQGHHLEVVRRDVTRLGNTSSEIQLGQTVPFVATADFVLTDASNRCLRIANCAAGTTLMTIDSSGVVRCPLPGIPFDSRAAARWIAHHYDFKFHVRGLERSPFRPYSRDPVFEADQHATIVPWIQEINTSSVRGDAIEIDFDVRPRLPPPGAAPRKPLLAKTKLPVVFDHGAGVKLELAVEGNYDSAQKLVGGTYWITLHSDDQPDLKLEVKVTSVEELPRKVPSEPAPSDKPALAAIDKARRQ